MTRGILCFFSAVLLCLFWGPFAARAEGTPPALSAKSAVLLSGDTGAVIFDKDAHERMSMASTTKIMTAMLALEEAEKSGNPAVEITQEMVAVEGSSMGLQAGDKIGLYDLAVGMLLASGNDAANSTALFLEGSLGGFAQRMNRRAEEIGMEDTHFVTPSGLDDEEHYSTAYDMALLAREALKSSSFSTIVSSKSMQVDFLEPKKRVSYTNHNKLLWLYEGCIGGKTGFTKKSGRCLVSAACREGITLIAVTLNAPDDWNDHTALFDYGFSTLQRISFDAGDFSAALPVVGAEDAFGKVSLRGGNGGSVTVFKEDVEKVTSRILLPPFLYAPVKAGDQVGKIQYRLEGVELYSVPIFASEDVLYYSKAPSFWEKLFGG